MDFRESLVNLLRTQCFQIPSIGAEVGVHRGRTSRRLLHEFPRLQLYMVDSWTVAEQQTDDSLTRLTAEQQEAFYKETLDQVATFADRIEILRMDSVAAVEHLQPLDFSFVDACHTREGCARDLAAYWGAVRSRGILCGHDYGKADLPGVTEAVDAFAAERGLDLHIEEGNIYWFRKS